MIDRKGGHHFARAAGRRDSNGTRQSATRAGPAVEKQDDTIKVRLAELERYPLISVASLAGEVARVGRIESRQCTSA